MGDGLGQLKLLRKGVGEQKGRLHYLAISLKAFYSDALENSWAPEAGTVGTLRPSVFLMMYFIMP